MGSAIVDQPFAVTTSWSISTWYPITYFTAFLDMYYLSMNVDCMVKYMYTFHKTCLWYTACCVLPSSEFNSLKNSTVWFVQLLSQHFVDNSETQHFLFTAAVMFSQQLRSMWPRRTTLGPTWCRWPTSPWTRVQQSGSQPRFPWQQLVWQQEPSSYHLLSTWPIWIHNSSTKRPTNITWRHGGSVCQQSFIKPWLINRLVNCVASWVPTLMPNFDKMILSKSPTGAVTTASYHATDGHIVTDNKEQHVLTSITVSKDQELVRLGNEPVNLLNRAYIMPQLQVECGSMWRFTADEISSTQHWTLMSNNDQAVMAKITTTLSWSNSFLWTYNYVFPTAVVTNSESDHSRALPQAIDYAGATCLNRLPQQESQRLWNLITDNVHFHELQQLKMGGARTTERLRGNSQICNWLYHTFDCESYIEAFNNYHQHVQDNMGENGIGEQQIEESQLYQSTRMAEWDASWDQPTWRKLWTPSANRH